MFDIIIVGGGPAGSTLARLIGKRYKVLLLEKRTFEDGEPGKCCGGLIAPDAQLMLAKFKLGIPKSVLLSPQLFAVRSMDFDNNLERYYQRHYINIDRQQFDKWLIDIVPNQVKIIKGSIFKSHTIKDNYINVKFNHKGREYEESTKILVGADGAYSKIRRQGFGDAFSPDLYISIQEWFQTEHNMDYYGAIFDSEITDFYSWTIPKENRLIVGSAIQCGDNANKKFDLLKKKMMEYGFKLEKSTKKMGAYIYRPTKTKQILTGNERLALIGEAAGFISPSSAEGLSYAFKSALILAKALNSGLDGFNINYHTSIKSLRRNILTKNIKSPAMYNGLARKLIMKSGLLSIGMEEYIK